MSHWRQKPKKRNSSVMERLAERDARRTSAISAALAELSPVCESKQVDYVRLADHTGIAVKYLQWRFPDAESLRQVPHSV